MVTVFLELVVVKEYVVTVDVVVVAKSVLYKRATPKPKALLCRLPPSSSSFSFREEASLSLMAKSGREVASTLSQKKKTEDCKAL